MDYLISDVVLERYISVCTKIAIKKSKFNY